MDEKRLKIILASGSPRRKELLKELLNKYNLSYEVIVSDVDEDPLKREIRNPEELVIKLSYIKAKDIFDNIKEEYIDYDLVVIGGDTIVWFDDSFLGKPKDEADAINMLERLQGKTNQVYTGTTVVYKPKGGREAEFKSVTSRLDVEMNPMTKEDIVQYVKTGEPMDKAGAYAVQGIGSKNIKMYVGNFDTAVGLNTEELEKILKEFGIV